MLPPALTPAWRCYGSCSGEVCGIEYEDKRGCGNTRQFNMQWPLCRVVVQEIVERLAVKDAIGWVAAADISHRSCSLVSILHGCEVRAASRQPEQLFITRIAQWRCGHQ